MSCHPRDTTDTVAGEERHRQVQVADIVSTALSPGRRHLSRLTRNAGQQATIDGDTINDVASKTTDVIREEATRLE